MRFIKRAALLLSLMMLLSVLPCAAASGNITYSGDAGKFIFEPGSEYSPTDLFPDLKDVMPGDSIEQHIFLRNRGSYKVKIKVYIRALGAHEDSVDFLSQLNLRVAMGEETVMFDAAADQTAQLTDWVCLGTLFSGGEVDLRVILDVPVTLDNTYSQQIGYLDWEFMIEEFPVEDTDPDIPDTGDDSGLLLYGGMFAGSALIFLILLVTRRKKKEEN